ncbi:Superfamily II helicase [Rothia kristinae]|nr:Superfamily II helicase [Rothia kristinae]
MANWLAGHTGTRFRCIVTHASLWDTDVMARTTDNGVWQEWLFDRDGAQGPENDPSRFVDRIQVPMLVIHGDLDYRVPVSQAHLLWADLRRRTDPGLGHRFLYFPDENHWVLKPGNSRLWYQTVLAFADRHVRGANGCARSCSDESARGERSRRREPSRRRERARRAGPTGTRARTGSVPPGDRSAMAAGPCWSPASSPSAG